MRVVTVWLLVLSVWCAGGAAAKPPVLLVPGLMGFRTLGVFGEYWKGWRTALEAEGYVVFESVPTPIATSAQRGAELCTTLRAVKRRTGADKVIVIAHSQGGVDVREALRQGAQDDILAVATLSSPHMGTPVADVSRAVFPATLVNQTLQRLQHLFQVESLVAQTDTSTDEALASLTVKGMHDYSRSNSTVPAVPFYSFAAVAGGDVDGSCLGAVLPPPKTVVTHSAPFIFGYAMMQWTGHMSDDGVVPTSSMRFGTFVGCIPGDHTLWTGWAHPFFLHRRFATVLAHFLEGAANVEHPPDARVFAQFQLPPVR